MNNAGMLETIIIQALLSLIPICRQALPRDEKSRFGGAFPSSEARACQLTYQKNLNILQ